MFHVDERIVFVDEEGRPTGETGPKLASHTADTKLHLAFSCYVFNGENQVLITQRAHSKKVWPGVWSNSLCGHPAPGEDMVAAIKRRLQFELDMTADNFEIILPRYRYKTPPYNGIIENEFCPVYVARATSEPAPNPEEVETYKWLEWDAFVEQAAADNNDAWSWWCKDQIKQLKENAIFQDYQA